MMNKMFDLFYLDTFQLDMMYMIMNQLMNYMYQQSNFYMMIDLFDLDMYQLNNNYIHLILINYKFQRNMIYNYLMK